MHPRLEANLLNLSLHRVTGRRKSKPLDNEARYARFLLALAAHRTEAPLPKQNDRQWAFRDTFPRPAPSSLPSPGLARGLSPDDAPDWDYFAAHTYDDLSRGF